MLSKKTIIGAGWLVSSRLGGRLIDFVTLLVLAKTLTPADFGLTALAGTVIAIVDTILEVPLLQALTRLKDVEKAHLDTAFTPRDSERISIISDCIVGSLAILILIT